MPKIVSRRGKPEEIDIEINLRDLDDDQPQVIQKDEPTQEEFEFYKEDWVIQYAVDQGYKVFHLVNSEVWMFLSDNGSHIFTEFFIQSQPDIVKQQLRDTMALAQQQNQA